MADVKSVLLTLQVDSKGAVTNLDAVRKNLKATGLSAKQLAAQLKEAENASKGLGGAAGIAGATLTEVGRTISDMPYGLGAITNNISQLGNMFALLVSSSGGLGAALKNLGTVFFGPVGILVAFQAAVAAIEMFNQKSIAAKKAVEAFKNESVITGAVLEQFREIVLDASRAFEQRVDALQNLLLVEKELAKTIEESNYTQSQQIDLAVAYFEQQKRLESVQKTIIDAQKELKHQFVTTDEAKKKIATNDRQAIELQRTLNKLQADANIDNREQIQIIKERLMFLEDENEELNENIEIISGLSYQVSVLRKEEQALNEVLEKGVFSLNLQGDALEEMEKNRETELKFAQKTAELTAQNEEAKINIRRRAALKEIEGIGGPKARYEINKYYDALITEERKKQAEERKKIAEKEADDQFKAFMKMQDERFKSALQGVKDEQKLIPLRKQLEYAQRALKAETEEERKAVLEDSLNYQKNYFQNLSESEAFTEAERIKFKMQSFDAIEQLRRLEEEKELERHERELERINKQAETFAKISEGLDTVAELFQASSDRELTIAKNATTEKNNQLRKELDNRNLTAEQRQKINDRIAKNEQKLAIEEDKIKEKAFKRQKAFQIGIALADTAGSALKAYASQLLPGDPTSVIRAQIAAGIATAFGLIQVATIAKQKYEKGEIPSISSGSGGSVANTGGGAPSFNVVGASELNQVAAAVAGQEKDPIRAYVVASDVSTAQEMDRNILSEASIG